VRILDMVGKKAPDPPPRRMQGGPADFGGPTDFGAGETEEELGWFERAQNALGVSSLSFGGTAEAFLDQLTLPGKVQYTGWLTYYDISKPRGERRWFVNREGGKYFTCYESELCKSGVRLFPFKGSVLTLRPHRTIKLADGETYSIREGFTALDPLGNVLEFEAADQEDVEAWVRVLHKRPGLRIKHDSGETLAPGSEIDWYPPAQSYPAPPHPCPPRM